MLVTEMEAGAVERAQCSAVAPHELVGWALAQRPRTWVYVACRAADGTLLALDIASRLHQQALEEGIGYGWCGFAFDLSQYWAKVRGTLIRLECLPTGALIFEYQVPDIDLEHGIPQPESVHVRALVANAQTQVTTREIRAMQPYIQAFIARFGNEEFVRRTYEYVLDRAGDEAGVQVYIGRLEAGLPCTDVVDSMYTSGERAEKFREPLALPGDGRFPYYPE